MDIQIHEDENLVAEATLTSHVLHFGQAWQMTFLEVPERHRRQGHATKLYHWANDYVMARGCRLLPSPDLSWEGFAFWRAIDREGLCEVLKHESSLGFVEGEGGDSERFTEQLRSLSFM